uniref:Uncharacterized protein n=1 Tax=Panstrongylus lignarius TaxID=156445 RepID=A0A224XSZ9_9HEMI
MLLLWPIYWLILYRSVISFIFEVNTWIFPILTIVFLSFRQWRKRLWIVSQSWRRHVYIVSSWLETTSTCSVFYFTNLA